MFTRQNGLQSNQVALKSAISAYSAIDHYQAQKVQAGWGALIAPDGVISHDYVTKQCQQCQVRSVQVVADHTDAPGSGRLH